MEELHVWPSIVGSEVGCVQIPTREVPASMAKAETNQENQKIQQCKVQADAAQKVLDSSAQARVADVEGAGSANGAMLATQLKKAANSNQKEKTVSVASSSTSAKIAPFVSSSAPAKITTSKLMGVASAYLGKIPRIQKPADGTYKPVTISETLASPTANSGVQRHAENLSGSSNHRKIKAEETLASTPSEIKLGAKIDFGKNSEHMTDSKVKVEPGIENIKEHIEPRSVALPKRSLGAHFLNCGI